MASTAYYNNTCELFEIERIDYSEAAERLPALIRCNKPVIISGISRHENIQAFSWNLDYLCHRIGANQTNVVKQPSGFYTFDDKEERTMCAMTFGEFVEKSLAEDSPYAYYLLKTELALYPEIADDLSLPVQIARAMEGQKPYGQYLFIGAKSIISGLHYDAVDAFNIQLKGRKRFTLFPPLGRNRFYPYSAFSQAGHISRVNAYAPDFGRFPRFREVEKHRIELVLEEGEALYIPACWWHQVESLGQYNINATYWFYPSFYKVPRMLAQYLQSMALQAVRLWKFKTIHMPRAKT